MCQCIHRNSIEQNHTGFYKLSTMITFYHEIHHVFRGMWWFKKIQNTTFFLLDCHLKSTANIPNLHCALLATTPAIHNPDKSSPNPNIGITGRVARRRSQGTIRRRLAEWRRPIASAFLLTADLQARDIIALVLA